MKGKGFSACLMCDSQNDLFLGNQLVLTIVRTRYDTDIFDIMLENTKVCIKCIGRLQQLHEFCAHNAVVTQNSNDDKENDKKKCDMCQLSYSSYELLPPNMLVGVDLTKWINNRDDDDDEEEGSKVISCYSCYYMICMYNETKDQLIQLLDYFYSALNNCMVIVKDCGSNADQGLANFEQEQFFGSLSLTPVEKSNRSRRSRVSFAPDVEVIPEPPIKRQRISRGNCNIASESVTIVETASRENITRPIANTVPVRQNTRNLRNSIGGEPRFVSPAMTKVKKSRRSTSAIDNGSSFEALKRRHNILECIVKLKRLAVIPAGSDQKKNENKGSAKKKSIKIKLNAKSKVIKRQINRLMRSEKKNASDELENSMNLEVVLTQENLNNTQSSTMSADPLNASINEDTAQNDSSSFALDDTLPVTSPTENRDAGAQIRDDDNTNKVSSKENNNAPVVRSTRKTRNSVGKLTESTNVAGNNRATRKRKEPPISPKKEAEDFEPESNENVEMIDEDEFIKYSPEEPEENLEQRYLLEIEFLNPVQYNNKAVKLNSTAMNNNEEEMQLLSTSQENFMALSSEDLEMNEEYLDESLEETLMNTRNSPQNDALCPIYTMDQLLMEDSLLSLT